MPTKAYFRFRGSKPELMAVLHNLPAYISGRKTDTYGIGQVFKLALAEGMFQQIAKAFHAKSLGNSDDLGDRWKPLSMYTVASKQAYAVKTGNKEATRMLHKTGELEKSLQPGGIATLSNGTGQPIGLSYNRPPGQSLKITASNVILGSTVKHAKYHHEGTAQIPQRRLWPPQNRIAPWVSKAASFAKDCLVSLLHQRLQ